MNNKIISKIDLNLTLEIFYGKGKAFLCSKLLNFVTIFGLFISKTLLSYLNKKVLLSKFLLLNFFY